MIYSYHTSNIHSVEYPVISSERWYRTELMIGRGASTVTRHLTAIESRSQIPKEKERLAYYAIAIPEAGTEAGTKVLQFANLKAFGT